MRKRLQPEEYVKTATVVSQSIYVTKLHQTFGEINNPVYNLVTDRLQLV